MHVFAFAVPGRYFFAGEHERHVASVFVFLWKCRNLFAKLLESRHWRVGFFGVVFGGVGEIVGVVRATDEVEPSSLGCLLQHLWACPVLNVICRVVRVAMHFASDKAGSFRWFFGKNLNF